jgi:phosphoribosylformylglycinamidine cyclo-ligase
LRVMKKFTYKKAGVDIARADDFIGSLNKLFRSDNKKGVKAFGSFFDLGKALKGLKEPLMVSSSDGVGTKLLLAQKLGYHYAVGIDLVAMNVNDIICLGAKPLFFLDYIACGKVKPKVLLEVAGGIKQGLLESGSVLCGGETAEMPDMYEKNEYDLAGFSVGIVDKQKVIKGKKIIRGDVLIGISSSGLHSNGFSLARKVLTEREIKKHAEELLRPTRIYVKPVLSLLTANRHFLTAIKGIAHVTGGAFYNKITKILPQGLGMSIYKKSWNIPEIFKRISIAGNISDKEMYTVFNMGIGMVLVVDKRYAQKVQIYLNKYFPTYVIGVIDKTKKNLSLV